MARRPTCASDQPSLFDQAPPAPLSSLDAAIREALGETLAIAKTRHGLDRYAVVAQINRLQPRDDGREFTKAVLDRCSASAGDWQLPAWRLPAICRIAGDYRLLHTLVTACDHRAVPSEAAALAELAMVELEEKRLKGRKELLLKTLPARAREWADRQRKGDVE
ncbi:hypothetical protein [Aureimonas frigidaquae]|uniref:hypothetical protein n=1 Tax=Aureimonas frigidaquae TaxID=424757 RepID=UPI0007834975|nr:hypothetical protein [Aureimonas frigidaquae]